MLLDRNLWIKGIKVSKLKEILDKLDPDTYVVPNQVMNLSLCSGNQTLGYIDTFDDTLELYETFEPLDP